MKKSELVNKLSRTYHKASFQVKKHSPEILIVAGVVGTVTSAVMACKATTKLNGLLENAKTQIDTIHDVIENPEMYPKEVTDNYTVEDSKKDIAQLYAKTGFEIAKLYAPAVILGALSITSIVASHNILRKRNVALAAAYTAVDTSFKKYRKRVVERFGEELDKELRYNIKAKEVEETVVDENGKEKTVKKTINVVDGEFQSEYARFYDDGCLGWTKDPELNLVFLKQQQNFANDLLKARGHVFLNEVYDMLGIPRTKAGNVVGWIYDEKNPIGDNFIDFGLEDIHRPKVRDFVNGYERVILLDFNVDGNILKLMD